MKNTKKDTFIWEGLGFPIRLVNIPMKKVLGEWVIDINFNVLQTIVLKLLVQKSSPLSGGELCFIIDYLEISIRDFAKLFGVTHAAALKWKKEESRMNLGTEVCLRLYILNHLNVTDKEFRKAFLKIHLGIFTNDQNENILLEFDAEKIDCLKFH